MNETIRQQAAELARKMVEVERKGIKAIINTEVSLQTPLKPNGKKQMKRREG